MTPQIALCLVLCVITFGCYLFSKWSQATVAMLSMVAFMLTGCLKPATVLNNLGNQTIIMMASMFLVSAGFQKTQTIRKMANFVNRIAKGSFTKVMAGYIIMTFLICQLIGSNLIPFCIFYPMLAESCKELKVSPSRAMFSLGITCIMVGGTLPLGSAAMLFSQENGYLAAQGVTEYALTLTSMPSVKWLKSLLCILFAIFIGPKMAPKEPVVPIIGMENQAANAAVNVKPMDKFHEIAAIVIFFGTSFAMFFTSKLGLATWQITLIGAILTVVLGVLDAKEAAKSIPISIMLLFFGALGMASALQETGAGALIGEIFAGYMSKVHSTWLVYAIFWIGPFLLTQFIYNQVAASIFRPIIIATCVAMGVSPVGGVIMCSLAATTAFWTPMATGTVPYMMGTGGYDSRTLVKIGWAPTLFAFLADVTMCAFMFPLNL